MANVAVPGLWKGILADALTAVTGSLVACKVGLFIGPLIPTPATTYADVTASGALPTYTGYLEQAASFGAPILRVDGSYVTQGDLLQFQPTGGTPTDVITGAYISDGSTTLLWAERFDNGVPLESVDSAVLYTPELQLGSLGTFGSGTVVG